MRAATIERRSLAEIEAALDSAIASPSGADTADLLGLAEAVLEHWIVAKGGTPTEQRREGFRLLALHRQGAKGEPSFNACRESCRELVYHHGLIAAEPGHPDTERRLRLAGHVARHICYFVAGKLEAEGLGTFCCAATPVRAGDATG